MTNTRAAARAALDLALRDGVPSRNWLERNAAGPQEAGELGVPLLILRDGEAEPDDEPTLGVRSFPWADTLTVEIHALTETAMEAVELVDTIIAELEAALADRQLGGAVDFLEVGQPQPVIADEIGVPPLLAATVPITLYYTSDRASG